MTDTQRKFVESFDVDEWEIETEDGFKPITHSHKTIPYEIYHIELDNGLTLDCADDHILMQSDMSEIFARDSLGHKIKTKMGDAIVTMVQPTGIFENMYDLSVDSETHTLYTNNILSHNTTVNTILILHYLLFHRDKYVAILANKEKAAKMVLSRIKLAFEIMPRFLKQRVKEWNKTKIEFHNGCIAEAAPTSSTSIRGESVNLLYIDEAAFVENWEEFYASTYSTVTAGSDQIPLEDRTKVILNSTANGLNHFYHIYNGAKANINNQENLANDFVPFEVDWQDVPGRDLNWKKLNIRNTSEEQFMQEQENQFLGGQNTLIKPGTLHKLIARMPEHITKEGIKIYTSPRPDHDYIVVVDTSHGKGLDYHAFSVFDITKYPFEQVATYRNNELSTTLYPNVIYLACRQYNMAYVLIENNDLGGMVVSDLNYDLEYENILSPKEYDSGQRKTRAYEMGIRMNSAVKLVGCSNLRDLVEKNQLLINDAETITELSVFVTKGKSYAADPKVLGSTDDLVITLVLFAWLVKTALFTDLYEDKTFKDNLFKARIQEIEQDLLPDVVLDDGLSSNAETDKIYDPDFEMYEVDTWQEQQNH